MCVRIRWKANKQRYNSHVELETSFACFHGQKGESLKHHSLLQFWVTCFVMGRLAFGPILFVLNFAKLDKVLGM